MHAMAVIEVPPACIIRTHELVASLSRAHTLPRSPHTGSHRCQHVLMDWEGSPFEIRSKTETRTRMGR